MFVKETMDHHYGQVLADRSFLAAARHAFLIRRPEEIAASYYALFPPMTINAIGMERLCQLQSAISDAGGTPPAVIDSEDLVTRPAATMAAYCAAVGLPFRPRALAWEPDERPEWRRSARWHVDASNSSGFEQHEHAIRTPSRTPGSWRTTPLTTGLSTNGSTLSGWMSVPGNEGQALNPGPAASAGETPVPNTVIATIPVPNTPEFTSVDPGRGVVWMSGPYQAAEIKESTHKIIRTVDLKAFPIAQTIDPVTGKLIQATTDGHVLLINEANGAQAEIPAASSTNTLGAASGSIPSPGTSTSPTRALATSPAPSPRSASGPTR